MMMGTPDSARTRVQISMPSMPGSMRSSRMRSGRSARQTSTALRAVGAEHRVESLRAQHDADHLGEGGVVIDHQDA